MATVQQAPIVVTDQQDFRPLLRRAQRTWRKAGVLRPDQHRLRDELHAELTAASDAGQDPSAVLGDDPTETLRQWAYEQNASGRALRINILAPLTILSIAIGSLPLITNLVVATAVPGAPFITSGAIWAAILLTSTIASWLLATLSCWAVLHRGGDPRAAATARWIFALLPVGAAVALMIDVVIATVSGTAGPFIPIMAIATAATFSATAGIARYLSTRYIRNLQPT